MLAQYASNFREMYFSDALASLVGVLAFAAIVFAAFAALLRRDPARAGVLASIIVVPSLYYIGLLDWANRQLGTTVPPSAALPVAALAVALLVVLAWSRSARPALPNLVLNGIAVALLTLPAWNIAEHQWRAVQTPRLEQPGMPAGGTNSGAAANIATARPDIYYLIFDRYGAQSTLADVYDFDNSAFIRFLEEKGFYVADESHSNYLKTAPSLASSLNMDYIGYLAADERAKRNDWHPIYDLLEGEHRVGRFVKEAGYRFINIGGWWNPTQYNTLADETYNFGFSEFGWLYLRRTVLPTLMEATAPQSDLALRLRWDNGQCQRAPQQFEQTAKIAERPEPTFTFVHVLLPHEPYVFDADGNCLDWRTVSRRGQKGGYVGQVAYANTEIERLVTALLDGPGPKPIIILQADEGPFPERYRTGNRSWRLASQTELRMKTAILNAYYFPDQDYSALAEDITPVNTFRVVFNQFFGTEFERLPNRIFAHPSYDSLYDYFDVTEIVRGRSPLP